MRCIDADKLQKDISVSDGMIDDYGIKTGYAICMHLIDEQPTIEPETEEEAYERGYTAGQMAQRKTGKWILIRIEENGNGLYECSECHKGEIHVPIVEVKYCWNCGTKMEGGEQDA